MVHELGGDYPDDVRKWDTFTMWKLLNIFGPRS